LPQPHAGEADGQQDGGRRLDDLRGLDRAFRAPPRTGLARNGIEHVDELERVDVEAQPEVVGVFTLVGMPPRRPPMFMIRSIADGN
jgi:hypothetical protein